MAGIALGLVKVSLILQLSRMKSATVTPTRLNIAFFNPMFDITETRNTNGNAMSPDPKLNILITSVLPAFDFFDGFETALKSVGIETVKIVGAFTIAFAMNTICFVKKTEMKS